ncbi:hypothetical protein [Brumimicrobium oceani]|uniref:Uncharacterized protein n=1 Tax=Brumimicrobium oceani TaxID=2100725 RepID=A0A2U2XGM6_9FLAO|nr:hypothetical protein [Brumimicrobium oceani]PWH86945.1 hypothetical protein DIT68_01415 [Brumimicrobium oceani]
MKTIQTYEDLLLEEQRIEAEVLLAKASLDTNIKSYLKPSNLFSFLEKKVEKEVDQGFSGDFELKKYLVSLSLDFLYNQVSEKLLTNKDEIKEGMDWKLIVKSYADQLYIGNKVVITDAVSDFIDQNIEKLKK